MTTMIYLSEPTTTRTRVRCFRVEIENPNEGEKSIAFHQENITEDQSEKEISKKQAQSLRVSLNDVVATVITINDPVTGKTLDISGAAVATYIEELYVKLATENIAKGRTTDVTATKE